MDYNDFKKCILNRVRKEVPDTAEVTMKTVRKNNGVVLDGLTILPAGKCIAPTIYINQYYSRYMNGLSIDAIVRTILEENQRYEVDFQINPDDFLDYGNVRDRIRFRLINYGMNEEFLADVPHIKFLDLAKLYYYEIRDSRLPSAFCTITNADLERWKVTVEEIDKVADANMKVYEPVKVFTMREMLDILMEGRDDAGELPEPVVPMYIMTNENRYFGAACILYDHVFDRIAALLNSDLYVLPSSIHEVIVTPVYDGCFSGDLGTMVAEINDECVPEYEVLSNSVYYYDRKNGELRILSA